MKALFGELHDGLQRLRGTFLPFADIDDDEVIEISGKDVRLLLETLKTMQNMALLSHRELGALRTLVEEKRGVTSVVKQELDSALDAKIVRPDFGRRT